MSLERTHVAVFSLNRTKYLYQIEIRIISVIYNKSFI